METRRYKQWGIGLLELMLALVVIAAIILMATRYFKQASEELKVTQATHMLNNIVDASFEWLKGEQSFNVPGFDTNGILVLIDAKLLPETWRDKPDPWGGIILLTAYGQHTAIYQPQQINIRMTGVPEKACNNIDDVMAKQGMALTTPCSPNSGYSAFYPATS